MPILDPVFDVENHPLAYACRDILNEFTKHHFQNPELWATRLHPVLCVGFDKTGRITDIVELGDGDIILGGKIETTLKSFLTIDLDDTTSIHRWHCHYENASWSAYLRSQWHSKRNAWDAFWCESYGDLEQMRQFSINSKMLSILYP